jgi:Protein kinase domain
MAQDDEAGRPPGAVVTEATRTAAPTVSSVGYVADMPVPRPDIEPGAHIDRYVIEERIGAGGMGVVYAAHDPDLDRRVAIKLLAGPRGTRTRLLREGQAVARLRHPNVVAIHDVGAHGSEMFIAMELVEGVNLRQWMAARPRRWREIVSVFVHAGRGLAAAHAVGLVHRDFKPDNVLVGDDGRVVVTDFGLARPEGGSASDDSLISGGGLSGLGGDAAGAEPIAVTRTGDLAGTPAYMSPEQFRGGVVDARSDQFSFCVALFEALNGARPFQRKRSGPTTLEELKAAVVTGKIEAPTHRGTPAGLQRAVVRGLSVEPADRFPTMAALIAALEPRRTRWWLLAAAIAAIAVAVIVGVWRRGATTPSAHSIDPCAAAVARLDGVWNDATRTAARSQALVHAADAPWVDDDLAALDRFAARWRTLRHDVCAHELAHDDALADRRALCLDVAVRGLARTLARTGAMRWPSVPSLTRCTGDAPDAVPAVHALGIYPAGDDALALSPDGERIARTSAGQLHLSGADGKDRAVIPLVDAAIDVRWTSDGRLLVVDEQGVSQVDLTSGGLSPLGTPHGMAALPMVVAPDGRRVALIHDGAVWLGAVDGSVGERRLAAMDGAWQGTAWAPDGRHLAISMHAVARNPMFRVIDVVDGTLADVPYRASRPLTRQPIPFAWLDSHRLVVDGDLDDEHGQGLWVVDVSRGGAAEPAEARLEAPPGTAYTIYDAAGGRVIAVRHVVHDHFGRLRAGALEQLAGSSDGMSILGIDRAGARLLTSRTSRAGSPLGWLSLADGLFTPIAAPAGGVMPVIAGDRVIAAGGRAGSWRIDELADDGGWRPRAPLALTSDAPPRIACGPAPAARCVVVWRDGAWKVAALDHDHVGPPIEISEREAVTVGVSPDGARVALGGLSGEVSVVDLATGRTSAWKGVPGCYHQYTAWSRTGPGLYVGIICARGANGYQLLRLSDGDARPEVMYRGLDWVGPPAVGAHDELYVNLRTFDEDFVTIDGL